MVTRLLSKVRLEKGLVAIFALGPLVQVPSGFFSEIFALNLAGERCFSLALLSWISICSAEIGGHSKVNQQTEDVFARSTAAVVAEAAYPLTLMRGFMSVARLIVARSSQDLAWFLRAISSPRSNSHHLSPVVSTAVVASSTPPIGRGVQRGFGATARSSLVSGVGDARLGRCFKQRTDV
jgi:hypothetical protein